ncbi:flavodoxin-dependent (E)-4-hydroxy-3-methylbut-2-enyl-diphosphate synthase, partial [Treponema sp. R6D11]
MKYPIHIGITEAGDAISGTAKNAIAIAKLLENHVGDTIRVSLSAPPTDEIIAAKAILRACGEATNSVEVISCPTCGRTNGDLINLAKKIVDATIHIKKDIKIAVMGCVVNGPG